MRKDTVVQANKVLVKGNKRLQSALEMSLVLSLSEIMKVFINMNAVDMLLKPSDQF